MNKPVFPSYQELLNEEAVSVPDALRLDTQPNIANDIIATDVWTDRGVFEKEVEYLWPKVWQMVCRETALQKAVEKQEFEVFYQPRISASGRVVSAEALIRWRRDGQIVSPALFIEALESTDLIVPVGAWVLRQATKACVRWRNLGFPDMRVSVNLSLRQLQQKRQFTETTRLALLESGLDAEALELELTESLMADNRELTLMMLQALRGMGVHLSIDDFGTGYSSLSYLRNFPFDCVKIDQAFIKDSESSESQMKLTRSIILMANALNLKTVAEGVETESLRQSIVGMGADELQGFFFTRPLPDQEFIAWLKQYSAS